MSDVVIFISICCFYFFCNFFNRFFLVILIEFRGNGLKKKNMVKNVENVNLYVFICRVMIICKEFFGFVIILFLFC